MEDAMAEATTMATTSPLGASGPHEREAQHEAISHQPSMFITTGINGSVMTTTTNLDAGLTLSEGLGTHPRAFKLLGCLLALAAATSVLNTVLLARIVKSVKLNDRGSILDGLVGWNQQLPGPQMDGQVHIASGHSLIVDSIEPTRSEPNLDSSVGKLRMVKWPTSHPNQLASGGMLTQDDLQRGSSSYQSGWITTVPLTELQVSPDKGAMIVKKSAYLDFSGDDRANHQHKESKANNPPKLIIGANQFKLRLVQSRASRNFAIDSLGKKPIGIPDHDDRSKHFGHAVGDPLLYQQSRILLDYNGDQSWIKLPLENKLKLSDARHYERYQEFRPELTRDHINSLSIENQLICDQIGGSLEGNLHLQTRDGCLTCKSKGGPLKLNSKSATAKLSSAGDLTLIAPILRMHAAKHLYIHDGLIYFDEVDDMGNLRDISGIHHDRGAVEDDDSIPGIGQEHKLSSTNSKDDDDTSLLRAFNLISINGRLIASSQ